MVQNALRKEASRLHVENNKLSSQVTRLETQVGRYVRVQMELTVTDVDANRFMLSSTLSSFAVEMDLITLLLAVFRLQDEEKKLNSITSTQGINVESFVQLVKENQETIDQLKVN
jgi:hypothetical protein